MANNLMYPPTLNQGMGVGAGGGGGALAGYGGVTTTTMPYAGALGVGYPGQMINTFPSYPQYDPPVQPDECGRIVIRKIDNGFVVMFQKAIGAPALQYYAEDMKAVGERITACLVAVALEPTK